MKDHENNYATHDLELAAIVHALKMWRNYLMGIKFEWTSKCEEIFWRLKYLLTSAPFLKVVDPEKDFVVCTDACGQGLGGVLM